MNISLAEIHNIAPDVDQYYVDNVIIAQLYSVGKIKLDAACEMLSVTHKEFGNILIKYGFFYEAEDLDFVISATETMKSKKTRNMIERFARKYRRVTPKNTVKI